MKLPIHGGDFDPVQLDQNISVWEAKTNAPDFWQEKKQASEIYTQLKNMQVRRKRWRSLIQESNDLAVLVELALEEKDEQQEPEIQSIFKQIQTEYQVLANLLFMREESDPLPAFLTIHAGAGGTEACDWAAMLYRMYFRWVERNQFSIDLIDYQAAEGGIKTVTVQVNGEFATGLLKGENGIHRLVRISPFDSNARRHTSFASVYISPVLNDTIQVEIAANDLRVDTYRASGAGGQHVNKTDSAVRLTHLPTKIVVQCQNERSQHKNRDLAMKMLHSRLYEYYRLEREKERQKNASEQREIGWGSQTRSYVFQPYTMVKDLRSKYETGNINAVMDGGINPFIQSYLRWSAQQFYVAQDHS